MKLDKCPRCGCFFVSGDDVCPNCCEQDRHDLNTLSNFLEENDIPDSAQSLSMSTGISMKNLNRFLEREDFSNLSIKLKNQKSSGNISLD